MDNTGESLLIFTRRQIAKTLASAFLLGGAQFSRHCANALGFWGEAVAAPAGSALATLTLVNSGGATQPSGVPTQTFGQPFKDGDIAPGTAPQFTVAGVSQPFSAGLQSYWPSGCLKFATFMLLPTFSLAAGASRVVTIARGGSWPAAARPHARRGLRSEPRCHRTRLSLAAQQPVGHLWRMAARRRQQLQAGGLARRRRRQGVENQHPHGPDAGRRQGRHAGLRPLYHGAQQCERRSRRLPLDAGDPAALLQCRGRAGVGLCVLLAALRRRPVERSQLERRRRHADAIAVAVQGAWVYQRRRYQHRGDDRRQRLLQRSKFRWQHRPHRLDWSLSADDCPAAARQRRHRRRQFCVSDD
jgi:hypothetical protein